MKKGSGSRRQRVLIDPAPGDVHVLMAGLLVVLKCDRAGLAGETKHPLDPVGGEFPLLPGECLPFAVPHLNMEERLLAFCRAGHDMHVAESILDIRRLEAAKLPQFGAFAVLAGRHIGGQPRPVIVRSSLWKSWPVFAPHDLPDGGGGRAGFGQAPRSIPAP